MRIAHPWGRSLPVILLAGLAVLSLSACGKRLVTCKQDNKDYVGAKEMPPLKAPEGLEAPDTRNALKVPPLNTPERVRGRNEPCLDAPPPFATAKSTAPAPPPPAAPAKPREVPTD
jgi:uncharacterized lipoprotein